MNRCQCKAGYAEGECKKHGLPIIHTITDESYCPACKIQEERDKNGSNQPC
jgi:hypothetical protein